MNFDDLSFKEFVHLCCQIYWHKVVHNILFLKRDIYIYFFLLDGAGSSLLHVGILQRVGVTLCCGAQALGTQAFSSSRALAQQVVVLWHVGSSRTRDQTRVSCIGRRIHYH